MAVRSCVVGNEPGFQNREPGAEPGPCYTYDPADVESRDFALRQAARDAAKNLAPDLGDPAIG